MNRFMQEKWSWIEGLNALRLGLVEGLDDADLSFNPGGSNVDLGILFRENGELEHSYIGSIKNFKQDWSYRNPSPGLDRSVSRLKAWYEALDEELKVAISALSDEDLKKMVVRGSNSEMPVEMQLDVYMQALFIFLGKATIYFKAMNRPLPPAVQEYIG